jgi:hypothetical protein
MGYYSLPEISTGAGSLMRSLCLVWDNERGVTFNFQNLQEEIQCRGEGACYAPPAGSGFPRRGLSDPEAPQVKSTVLGHVDSVSRGVGL